jgi:hypothetical protein
MAPRQHSGSADPGAPRPEEFDHQKYDYRPAHPDRGFGGAILNGIGTVQDVVQRDQLEQGLSMRPAGHIPRTNADSYDHPQLKQMIDASQADQADELGQMWNTLGNEIMVFGANLQRTATSSEAIWVGQAGNAARGTLSGLAGWSNTTGQGVQYMGTTMRTQADAARTAKRTMPDPVDYSPADYQARLNSTMNPIEWVQIIGDARQQADKQQAAHAEAVRVTETYSASLHDVSGTMPAFTPPQQFGNGDTGVGGGSPMPGGGAGGGGGSVPMPGHGGIPGGGPGAGGGHTPAIPGTHPPGTHSPGPQLPGPGGNDLPPAPTPGQVVTLHTPAMPGGPGWPGGPSGPGGGAEAVPGFVPAAGIGGPGGAPGSGARFGGGRAGSAGGGFGPRGGAGPNSVGRNALGALGEAESAAGAGRGAASMAGRGAGAGSEMAPMAGGGRGRGDDDTEHRRPSYLVETEDVWGDGRRVAPPVIGEDPPDYYH